MDSLALPDSDTCGDCGLDMCNCNAEVARRLAQYNPPKGLAADLPQREPIVTRAPDPAPPPSRTRDPAPLSRFGVPIGGLELSLDMALAGFAELQAVLAALDPAVAARLDFLFATYVRAAREDLADLRRDTRDLSVTKQGEKR